MAQESHYIAIFLYSKKRNMLLHSMRYFCAKIWVNVTFLVVKFGIVGENYVICAA